MCSLECYFGIHFPRYCTTREINTKITFSWAHKQFGHASTYIIQYIYIHIYIYIYYWVSKIKKQSHRWNKLQQQHLQIEKSNINSLISQHTASIAVLITFNRSTEVFNSAKYANATGHRYTILNTTWSNMAMAIKMASQDRGCPVKVWLVNIRKAISFAVTKSGAITTARANIAALTHLVSQLKCKEMTICQWTNIFGRKVCNQSVSLFWVGLPSQGNDVQWHDITWLLITHSPLDDAYTLAICSYIKKDEYMFAFSIIVWFHSKLRLLYPNQGWKSSSNNMSASIVEANVAVLIHFAAKQHCHCLIAWVHYNLRHLYRDPLQEYGIVNGGLTFWFHLDFHMRGCWHRWTSSFYLIMIYMYIYIYVHIYHDQIKARLFHSPNLRRLGLCCETLMHIGLGLRISLRHGEFFRFVTLAVHISTQSNVVSHWLAANLESALSTHYTRRWFPPLCLCCAPCIWPIS